MINIGGRWMTVIASGAEIFVQLWRKADGAIVAVDPETNNEYDWAAFRERNEPCPRTQ